MREAEAILKFIPEDRKKPPPKFTWGSYGLDDLVRLTIVRRLRETGWTLEAALAAIGRNLLETSPEPEHPVATLVIFRVNGEFRLRRCWNQTQVAEEVANEAAAVKTVIAIDELRQEVERKIAEMSRANANSQEEQEEQAGALQTS